MITGDKYVYGYIRGNGNERIFNNAYGASGGSTWATYTGFNGWVYVTGTGVLYADYWFSSYASQRNNYSGNSYKEHQSKITSDGALNVYSIFNNYCNDITSTQKISLNAWQHINFLSYNIKNNSTGTGSSTSDHRRVYICMNETGTYEDLGLLNNIYVGYGNYMQVASSTIAIKGAPIVRGAHYKNTYNTSFNVAGATVGSAFSQTVNTTGSNASTRTFTSANNVAKEPDTYYIYYNANGGSSTPGTQTCKQGNSITLAAGIARNNTSSTSSGTITISYNANGGSSTPGNGTGTYVNTTTTTYKFSQWAAGSASGTKYNASSSYTPSGDVTMYATWTSSSSTARTSNPSIKTAAAISRASSTVSSYKVSYNANGGSSTPSAQTATKTRSYTFSKWNTNSAGSGTNYNANTNYTFSANATLYATWTSSDSGGSITLPAAIARANGSTGGYSVTYNANGGSGAPSAQTSGNRTITYTFSKWAAGSTSGTQYNAGASFTPSAATTMYAIWNSSTSANSSWTCSSTIPTRTGHTFLGWSTSSTATSATYKAGTAYTITNGLTLYAVWQKNNYTITIRRGTGIADITQPAISWTNDYKQTTAAYGSSFTVNASVSAGYHWVNWTGSFTTTTQQYTFTVGAQNYDVTANAAPNTYTVAYNANGGSGTTASSSHTYNAAKALTANGFSRTGYTFLGWSTNSAATTATYTNGQEVSNLTTTNGGTVTLYAIWQINSYYLDVNWTLDGESFIGSSSIAVADVYVNDTKVASAVGDYYTQHNYGSTYKVVATTKTGYSFSDGTTSKTLTGTIGTSAVNALFALITNTYNVAYNANGGLTTPETQTAKYNTEITIANAISKANTDVSGTITLTYNANGGDGTISNSTGTYVDTIPYTFNRWALNSVSGTQYEAGSTYTIPASNSTMYATWTAGTQTRKTNPSITITSSKPTRSGYTFLGWAETSTAKEPTYLAETAYTFAKDTTLYAVWKLVAISGGVMKVQINDEWKDGEVYVNVNREWKKTEKVYINVNGEWKESIQ